MDESHSNYDSPMIDVLRKSAVSSKKAREEGNHLFKEKNQHSRKEHRRILNLYSKSIAFAPNGSEELALGYGNRSYLLNHMKMYQSSITDIDRALVITKSDTLRAKLLVRKIACMKAMNKRISIPFINKTKKIIEAIDCDEIMKFQLQDSFNKAFNQRIDFNNLESKNIDLPKIDFDRELPATSTSIRMEHSKDLGRHYRATKDILTGEILIIEQGYVAVAMDEHLYIVCSFCLKFTWTGIPCHKCPCVIYCSERCKEAAWKSYHDLECNILMLIYKDVSSAANIRLALRILMKGLKEDPEKNLNFNYLLSEFVLANNSTEDRCKGFKNNKLGSGNIRSIFSLIRSNAALCKNDSHQPSIDKLTYVLQTAFKELSNSEFYAPLRKFNIYNITDFINYMAILAKINFIPYMVYHCNCKDLKAPDQMLLHSTECRLLVGKIIGVNQSLVNHSCVPNAARILRDGEIILFAIRPITKHDQICCSYGPHYTSSLFARAQFMSSYQGVICNCLACKKKWDLSSLSILDQRIKALNLGEQFLWEIRRFANTAYYNKEILIKRDMKKKIDQLKSKINTIYRSNSLLDASTVFSFMPDVFCTIYEIYYSGDWYMPDDFEKDKLPLNYSDLFKD